MALRVFRLISTTKIAVGSGWLSERCRKIIYDRFSNRNGPESVVFTAARHGSFHLYRRYRYIRKRSGFNHFVFTRCHTELEPPFWPTEYRASAAAEAAARKICLPVVRETRVLTLGATRATSAFNSSMELIDMETSSGNREARRRRIAAAKSTTQTMLNFSTIIAVGYRDDRAGSAARRPANSSR